MNRRDLPILAIGLELIIIAAILLGCSPLPKEFASSIKLGDEDFQKTTLEELDAEPGKCYYRYLPLSPKDTGSVHIRKSLKTDFQDG